MNGSKTDDDIFPRSSLILSSSLFLDARYMRSKRTKSAQYESKPSNRLSGSDSWSVLIACSADRTKSIAGQGSPPGIGRINVVVDCQPSSKNWPALSMLLLPSFREGLAALGMSVEATYHVLILAKFD